ncbi:Ankyrin repeat protein [Hirsutella rhossiliensis]|uniref:Ankyrin repeat protein n=1 Tax=Hirsutella rhossiliensis TaxID=111463 RepID=A0A9P8SFT1_9HYPO|nr:Ankyrin repeat protein [Hirsutella rhossiliensis]KAH0961081.1 Ankyrin repeat protein [Hirsutella rhossiliensis]
MDPVTDPVAAPRRSVAAAISVLRDSATSLCFNDLGKPPDPAQTRPPCRGLATELLLFGGALFSLEALAAELESASHEPVDADSLLFLQQINSLLQSVRGGLATLTPGLVSHFREESKALRSKITHVLARSRSLADLVILLSAHNGASTLANDPQHASDWVKMLIHPRHNREPRNFHLEKRFIQGRRVEFPDYSHAATRWLEYAEDHWPILQPRIIQLFTGPPQSFNFVQWALEYARETWPARFGLDCADPRPTIDLTNHLCNGSISPLHLAAALGLPNLVQTLLSSGTEADQPGPLGTPLYCALVGHHVLVAGDSPESWSTVLRHDPRLAPRHAAVRRLLDAGPDCTWRFRWPGRRKASLAGLAFWFACLVNDHTIFERVLEGGATIDDDFAFLISDAKFVDCAKPYKYTLGLLLTCAFDSTYDNMKEWPWHRTDSVLEAIGDLMRQHQLDFACGLGQSRRLANVSDLQLPTLVRGAILDDEVCQVQRLSMDPRFDPNLLANEEVEGEGNIAHLAIEGDNLDVVDVLAAAGADFTARDGKNRTPLMRVESVAMLSKLVQLGLPTTDTDETGRNIWHFAAATNDLPLLEWLAANDPSKEENLTAVTAEGYTPLEEALQYSRCSRGHRRLSKLGGQEVRPSEPVAAFYILSAGAVCRNPPPFPLISSAVDWGSVDLVRKLYAVGADPRAVDELGRTALHYLNISATPALVSLVQGFCSGLPVSGPDVDEGRTTEGLDIEAGLTPAETILTNTSLIKTTDQFWTPSEHNSCRGTLSGKAYTLLLTPQMLDHRDRFGRGMWARFCQKVLIRLAMQIGVRDAPSDCSLYTSSLEFLRTSLLTAIDCLIRQGALARHEDETGLPAVLCLHTAEPGETDAWPEPLMPFAQHILERFVKSPLAAKFYQSPEATKLLIAAHHYGQKELIDMLNEKFVVGFDATACSEQFAYDDC